MINLYVVLRESVVSINIYIHIRAYNYIYSTVNSFIAKIKMLYFRIVSQECNTSYTY